MQHAALHAAILKLSSDEEADVDVKFQATFLLQQQSAATGCGDEGSESALAGAPSEGGTDEGAQAGTT